MPWTLAPRAHRMNPSPIREILKLAERPGVISLAGGFPSPQTFPAEVIRDVAQHVLRDDPQKVLQYAASEGFAPLREWIAQHLARDGMQVDPSQVLITSGSQQGLDLVGKVLIEADAGVAVETPTYLGALQAFTSFEPQLLALPCDEEGTTPEGIGLAHRARFAYLLPNFQNPTGRMMSSTRREALVRAAQAVCLPLVEDNPYGDLWFDDAPPAPLAARWPEGVIYLGSFSKVLVPGLRIGYLVAPKVLYPKLLQAKQAADLHTPVLNQRLVHEVIREGFLDEHVPSIRGRYRAQRDAMARALECHMPNGCHWQVPRGGMFFWVRTPEGIDTAALLRDAVERGVSYVPGAAFYAGEAPVNTLRLSFVTESPERIEAGIAALARAMRAYTATGARPPKRN